MTFGEKLQLLRKQNGLSQEQLAAQLEVSRQAVSKWESGVSFPDMANIVRLSEIFHVSTDYLLKDEKEEPEENRNVQKKKILAIAVISGVAIIGTISTVCMFQNIGLRRKLARVQENLGNQMYCMEGSVSGIRDEIQNQLEKQAHLLAVREPSWSEVDIDLESKTATVKCTVVPKEFQENVTTVALVCNGTRYPMMLEEGRFAATLKLPLFSESKVTEVQFREKEDVRTQLLDWSIRPRYEFFPNIYTNYFDATTSCEKKDGKLNYHSEGEIEVQLERKNTSTKIQSIYLVPTVDGKDEKKIKLKVNTEPSSQMYEKYPDQDLSVEYLYCEMNETFQIPYGSVFELYVEAVDENELHYRMKVEHMVVDKYGDYRGEGGGGVEASIYDKDGNPLYLVEE